MNRLTFNPRLKNRLAFILAFALSAAIGTYFRMIPLTTYAPGDYSEKATLLVIAQLRQHVEQNLSLAYPNLSTQQREVLATDQFNKLLHNERDNVRRSIDKLSQAFKQEGLTKRQYPYLLESDPFYYYGLTENILRSGSLSPQFKSGRFLNPLMLAPNGYWESLTLHPYIGVLIYKVLKIFNPNVNLMYAVSYCPVILALLALIPYFWICASWRIRPLFSLAGAIFLTCAPIFIRRSAFGWYDTDPYNILFPFLIIALVCHGLKLLTASLTDTPSSAPLTPQTKTHFLTLGFLTACLIFIYSFFWQGATLITGILLAAGILICGHSLLARRDFKKGALYAQFFGIIVCGTILLTSVAFGFSGFAEFIGESWKGFQNFLTPRLSIWPDLFISVGELEPSTWNDLAEMTGGPLFLCLSGFGFVYLGLNLRTAGEQKYPFFVLAVFALISLGLAMSAQRFLIFCLAALALGFPAGLQFVYDLVEKISPRLFKSSQPRRFVTLLALLILTATAFFPINLLRRSLKDFLTPIFNETWETSLIRLRDNTPDNSIVNTWWCPGHFIKAIAHRRVTFDGATINAPQSYWISNIFLSPDEKSALGMLRMLNGSGNQAADYLHNELKLPVSASVALLKIMAGLNSR
ncbi:MAG: hypothetical protein HQL23_09425, partial [Candidatus Omnitrophica bacterium]|nr:hypothetical protein [Candidatus Omnitrophota bacterium]